MNCCEDGCCALENDCLNCFKYYYGKSKIMRCLWTITEAGDYGSIKCFEMAL